MGRSKDVISSARKLDSGNTKKQLKAGVKIHKLILGKPSYDILIDDKSLFLEKLDK